jgi:ABC-2 type transport system permease protein
MSTPSDADASALDAPARAAPALPATRPFLWSVRRELWENRSVYLAPLLVAGVYLLAFTVRLITLPQRMRAVAALDPAQQRGAVMAPFSTVAAVVMLTAFVVGAIYALDALHGERRDRSILFWKSLPVSDLTTVLAKAAIPMAVLPALAMVIVAGAQAVMLLLSTLVLLPSGAGVATLWRELPFVQMPLIQVYGLAVHALWFAPLYAWMILVSAWARRMALLWALLPAVAIGGFERVAFGTSHVCGLLGYRVTGAMREAFTAEASGGHVTLLTQLDPIRFLTSAGLWLGLLFAAVFLAAATRLRRRRGPI